MKSIPLLDTTIAGSIDVMASDVRLQLMDKMKVAEMFLLQLGERCVKGRSASSICALEGNKNKLEGW